MNTKKSAFIIFFSFFSFSLFCQTYVTGDQANSIIKNEMIIMEDKMKEASTLQEDIVAMKSEMGMYNSMIEDLINFFSIEDVIMRAVLQESNDEMNEDNYYDDKLNERSRTLKEKLNSLLTSN